MPKRTDIKKILLLGSGPIVIGQGCEFDYSGCQACKALRRENYEIVLVNSNPATIMTDPQMADRTYIEPLTVDSLHEIIRRERPDALLPTLGGQTALNLALALADAGILRRYKVELIGATEEAIRKAEDRELFKQAMAGIGLDLPKSGTAHTLDEAYGIARLLGTWPLIIRPAFTLGGTGGGIARNEAEFREIAQRGLAASRNSEILIEESLLGWKEFEMEVIRDKRNTSVIVCSIENLDPMGVHTGDSITVAPAQTLTDREYQTMRDASLRVMEAIGVETGGSNVQWGIHSQTGRMVIIEMNPRVSRSSALASKATGFPIAKIAALLAVGYTLDELRNDITRSTPACFEPALDYVVVKVPRFTFEKFPGADKTLGTQMKSVGEAMAIGRSFREAFQKALRSLETGMSGFGGDAAQANWQALSDDALLAECAHPSPDRVRALHEALRRSIAPEALYETTGIDPWFLRNLRQLVELERDIAALPLATLPLDDAALGSAASVIGGATLAPEAIGGATLATGSAASAIGGTTLVLREAKRNGFSDRQIAYLTHCTEARVRALRRAAGIAPFYGTVDTCAGEFAAITPYFYSTYDATEGEPVRQSATPKKRIVVLGGGPNRIGQGIEFDYCCCHASFALREAGCEVIMVNSNPETVSTDYDTSDKLYFEPLTLESVLDIVEREQADGVIVQFGGQTPLNLADGLQAAGVNILGTSPKDIDAASDRGLFKALAQKIGITLPASGIAYTAEEALAVAADIGYPVLVRPSFVLGGRAMVIVHTEADLQKYMAEAEAVSEGRAILIDRFLEEATELDVDCLSDGEHCVIGAIMEHVELAGIHSGDSACSIPTRTLSKDILDRVRSFAYAFARELHVCGLMNMQLAVHGDTIYMIEVNPRASRTVPFVSKATSRPLAKLASLCMIGKTLPELGVAKEIEVPYTAFKEAVFPFVKFPGVDITLSPEMKSTGEVMGIDLAEGVAYLKSQMAAGNAIPEKGGVLVSFKDSDKAAGVEACRRLREFGFELYATRGTATRLWNSGIKCHGVYRISYGRPNILDLMNEGLIGWIVNTPESGGVAMEDEIRMRSAAVALGIPVTTTIAGLLSALEGLTESVDAGRLAVCSLQEYHRMLLEKNTP